MTERNERKESQLNRFWPIFLVVTCGVAIAGVIIIVLYMTKLINSQPWTLVTYAAATPALILLWVWRDQHRRTELHQADERRNVALQAQYSDRYVKAVELLGSEKSEIRLGGIYALEQILRDSPPHHWTVIETLSAFIRENAPRPPSAQQPETTDPLEKPPNAIQAALTVLGRRPQDTDRQKQEHGRIDLSFTYLRGANLYQAQLNNVIFAKTDLDLAKMHGAALNGANFYDSSLRYANFENAKLIGAYLQQAKLDNTDLSGANLSGAKLNGASWGGASLDKTNLEKADLKTPAWNIFTTPLPERPLPERWAQIATKLSRSQLANAITDENTKLPDYLIDTPAPENGDTNKPDKPPYNNESRGENKG